MKTMKKALIALWQEEAGLTMVEYAVAGGLIAAAGVAAFLALGGQVDRIINILVTDLGTIGA